MDERLKFVARLLDREKMAGYAGSLGCPPPYGLTTACRSPHPMRSSDSVDCRSGGWARGISIERIKPGNPQQNGRHELVGLTSKQNTTKCQTTGIWGSSMQTRRLKLEDIPAIRGQTWGGTRYAGRMGNAFGQHGPLVILRTKLLRLHLF